MSKTQYIIPSKGPDPFQTRMDEAPVVFEEKAGEVFGDCVIERPLGMGGAAAVYLARHTKLETKRALKVLKAEHLGNIKLRNRFIREAKISARLNHPGIAHIYDAGEQNGKPYIEMEFVDGVALRELLKAKGVFPVPVAIAITLQILEALAYAHAYRADESGRSPGIIHRDIKPENILVTPGGRVKIVDFGIAKAVEWEGETVQGAVLGTCGYMPVEQIDGKEIDARADLYSACVVLYEMLGGRLPYAGDTYTALIKNIASHKLIPLRRSNGAISRDVEALVHKGLNADKEERFQDAAGFMEIIRKRGAGKIEDPTRLIAGWLADSSAHPARERAGIKVLLSAALLLTMLGGVILFWPKEGARPQPAPVKPVVVPATVRDTLVPVAREQMDRESAPPPPVETRKRVAEGKAPRPRPDKFTVLDQGKDYFAKGDYFNAERLLVKALQDTSVRDEAAYFLLRISDARFRAGQTELKEELKVRLQAYIRENAGRETSRERVRDAKERLLFILKH